MPHKRMMGYLVYFGAGGEVLSETRVKKVGVRGRVGGKEFLVERSYKILILERMEPLELERWQKPDCARYHLFLLRSSDFISSGMGSH